MEESSEDGDQILPHRLESGQEIPDAHLIKDSVPKNAEFVTGNILMDGDNENPDAANMGNLNVDSIENSIERTQEFIRQRLAARSKGGEMHKNSMRKDENVRICLHPF